MKNKPDVVLDTNIFIKGLFFEYSACCKIMNLIEHNKVHLLFSQDTIGELVYLIKNFTRHYVNNNKDRLSILDSIIELFYYSTSVNTIDISVPHIKDKYDVIFLKCATGGHADFLVSDDYRSGLHELQHIDCQIVNSEEFINVIK